MKTPILKLLASINALGALASLALLIFTFHAEGFIVDKARTIALDKTRAYMDPAVTEAEKMLEQRLIRAAMPETVREKIRFELDSYQASPDEWLLELSTSSGGRAAEFEFPEVTNPIARKSLDFLTRKVAGARVHFENSFANLILDLRIFSITNLVACSLAAGLCFAPGSARMRFWMAAWSVILLLSTLLSVMLYKDQSWVWRILTNRYNGWGYASLHFFFTLYFGFRILPHLRGPEAKEA